ncbi:small subunit ribosomal protein S9 [Ereboglobus sp. PH5-5]|uniref:30S ribosomal protein S9 n=1 Tax=unclassified Ereboglobus TaxID=2626932 RepID=UPI002405D78D|nr:MULTISPECIES: 30S ribosomal protein S9 [unclassified Ereboglobus]MDF9826707.1 small subunit ribosomal protein S9 [Ereboglobus sp. PH5-10]MDF9833393.1 small subunit ribosomal protein S9 [Ereboglobus sp. PH5-5]
MSEKVIHLGTGRRKTSVARVRLSEGSGKFVVNELEYDKYFPHETFSKAACAPLIVAEMRDKVDVTVLVDGGGVSGQAGAVAHGIARALQKLNPELRPALKKAGHIRRDPREKERKKAGQPGARKRYQFSKR